MPLPPENGKQALKALIIESSAPYRYGYKQLLMVSEEYEFVIIDAHNGEVGLELYHQHCPDIVLLDVKLPGMNGLEVLARMEGSKPGVPPPVIIVSGDEHHETSMRALKLGAQDYIIKDSMVGSTLNRAITNTLIRIQLYEEAARQNSVAVRAQRDGEESARAMSDFLANMSHEMRTPLTAIIGYAQELIDGDLVAEEMKSAQVCIHRSGEHVLHLINEILDVAKIKAGMMEVEIIETDLAPVLSHLDSLLAGHMKTNGVEFQIRYTTSVPARIKTDPFRLQQILINLINNSIKFAPHGMVELDISLLNPEADEPTLRFDIVDTGIGMTPEQAARLFQPFSQAEESTSRDFGGTGLGLTISKSLANALGGDVILADTKKGCGSRFRVTIGVGPLDPSTLLKNPAAQEAYEASAKSGKSYELENYRILVADDSRDNQVILKRMLEKAGASVEIAEDGEIAARKTLAARQNEMPFDIVLMDMQMPVMDGFEATSYLRSNGYEGPIVALTASALSADREHCIESGCNDFASKPINKKLLIETLRQNARRSRDLHDRNDDVQDAGWEPCTTGDYLGGLLHLQDNGSFMLASHLFGQEGAARYHSSSVQLTKVQGIGESLVVTLAEGDSYRLRFKRDKWWTLTD